MTELFFGTSGPIDAEIVLVGEAYGYEENAEKRPFVGSAGNELNKMLAEANIMRDTILCTNIIPSQPVGNDMWRYFYPKDDAPDGSILRNLHPLPLIRDSLSRLYEQINKYPRKLVIATGNYPLWALTDCAGFDRPSKANGLRRTPNGIMNWRGSMWHLLEDPFNVKAKYSNTRLLPVIHPASILRQWENRAITVHDFKNRIHKAVNEDWRPNPMPIFWAPPTFLQATSRIEGYLARLDRKEEIKLACDIETAKTLITVVGVADSTHFAMAIPFVQKSSTGLDSYWSNEEEATLIRLLGKLLTHKNIKIIGQNFIYDTQYFQHWMGAKPNLFHDTMVCQNLLFPGTPKALDYLSSMYCSYHWFWKEDGKEWDTTGTLEDLLIYNCWDLVRTFEVHINQLHLIKILKQEVQWEIKKKINDLCLRMMNRGVKIDTARRMHLTIELSGKLSELEAELLYIIPQTMLDSEYTPELYNKKKKALWYKSPSQMQKLFYDHLGMRVVKNRKTGQPTVGKEALNDLVQRNPEWTPLFNRIRLYNSADNTAGVLRSGLDSDNRMRCSFNPAGTETHRLSSSTNAFGRGTNLQNLTRGKED